MVLVLNPMWCEFDGEAYYGNEDHPDNQLEKGKEVLKELMGGI